MPRRRCPAEAAAAENASLDLGTPRWRWRARGSTGGWARLLRGMVEARGRARRSFRDAPWTTRTPVDPARAEEDETRRRDPMTSAARSRCIRTTTRMTREKKRAPLPRALFFFFGGFLPGFSVRVGVGCEGPPRIRRPALARRRRRASSARCSQLGPVASGPQGSVRVARGISRGRGGGGLARAAESARIVAWRFCTTRIRTRRSRGGGCEFDRGDCPRRTASSRTTPGDASTSLVECAGDADGNADGTPTRPRGRDRGDAHRPRDPRRSRVQIRQTRRRRGRRAAPRAVATPRHGRGDGRRARRDSRRSLRTRAVANTRAWRGEGCRPRVPSAAKVRARDRDARDGREQRERRRRRESGGQSPRAANPGRAIHARARARDLAGIQDDAPAGGPGRTLRGRGTRGFRDSGSESGGGSRANRRARARGTRGARRGRAAAVPRARRSIPEVAADVAEAAAAAQGRLRTARRRVHVERVLRRMERWTRRRGSRPR